MNFARISRSDAAHKLRVRPRANNNKNLFQRTEKLQRKLRKASGSARFYNAETASDYSSNAGSARGYLTHNTPNIPAIAESLETWRQLAVEDRLRAGETLSRFLVPISIPGRPAGSLKQVFGFRTLFAGTSGRKVVKKATLNVKLIFNQ